MQMQTLFFFFSIPSQKKAKQISTLWYTQRHRSRPLHSSSQGGAAALNQLNLLGGPDVASEAGRELVTVEKDALGRGNGGKSCGGRRANARVFAALPRLLQGPVLLGALAVLGKGSVRGLAKVFGEGVGGRGGVRLGSVVDGS